MSCDSNLNQDQANLRLIHFLKRYNQIYYLKWETRGILDIEGKYSRTMARVDKKPCYLGDTEADLLAASQIFVLRAGSTGSEWIR